MTRSRSPLFTSVRHARKRRWPRALRFGAIGLAALLVIAAAVAIGLWRYANAKIDRVDLPALNESPANGGEPPIEGTLNVLVVGSDTREGLTDQELEILGTEAVGGQRTDTIMLVQLTPVREEAVILSFPRDLKVDIPGHGDRKINAAYGLGGPDLLIQTVQSYTGIDLDHYVEVDLAGFLRLAEALGGIEVCLDEPIDDVAADGRNFTGLDLPAGCQKLDKFASARFVRARHSTSEQFGAHDFGRIARQQYFIRQSMREVTSAGTLLNPFKVKRLIDVVAAAVTTDKDLGASEMLRLANALKDLTPEDVESRVVPSYAGPSFVYAYPEQAEALFQALRTGSALPPVGTTLPEELEPADVRIRVLNGVGTEGLASEVQQFLERQGFAVASVDNADTFEIATTVIEHGPEARQHAELVAEHFPGAELRSSDAVPDGVDVVVVVGQDWSRP